MADEQVSINLANDISYVSGTVNGAAAQFSLTAENTWTAVVPKAPDGKYAVSISAYNNLGSSTSLSTVIYKLDSPMPFNTGWKDIDYYNAGDLNRVEANTQFIADYLRSLEYEITLENIKTDRDMTSIDFLSDINRIARNIEAVRRSFLTPPDYMGSKTWVIGIGFNYLDANRLENNLQQLYIWALYAKDNQVFCGTFSCGTNWEGGLY